MILGWLAVIVLGCRLVGGRFYTLAELRFKRGEYLGGAVIVQLLGVVVIRPHSVLGGALVMLAGFAMLGVVAWSNRRLPGVYIIMVGLGFNILVITANGGTMPTTAAVVKAIGRSDNLISSGVSQPPQSQAGPEQSSTTATVANTKAAISPDPKLLFLGDVIVIPLPGRLASAVSIGDIILAIGLIPLCGWAMGASNRGRGRGRGKMARLNLALMGWFTSLFSISNSKSKSEQEASSTLN